MTFFFLSIFFGKMYGKILSEKKKNLPNTVKFIENANIFHTNWALV